MPIIIPKLQIHYTPVPKAACSSIKNWFFQLENGMPFKNSIRNGSAFHIHSYYSTTPFRKIPPQKADALWKFAVIRDPAKRLVSCYANRVVHYNELGNGRLSLAMIEMGAAPNPSLEYFIENLETYMSASASINHHASPLTFSSARTHHIMMHFIRWKNARPPTRTPKTHRDKH